MPRFLRLPLVLTVSLSLSSPFASAQTGTNVALGKPARQSSEYGDGAAPASLAVDGITDGNFSVGSVTHTAEGPGGGSTDPWWEVDLGADYELSRLTLHKRTDCCLDRWREFRLLVRSSAGEDWRELWRENIEPPKKKRFFVPKGSNKTPDPVLNMFLGGGSSEDQPPVRYIRIQMTGEERILSIAEVEAYGEPAGTRAELLASTTTCHGPYGEVNYPDSLGEGKVILFTQANYRGQCNELTYKDDGPYGYSVPATFTERGFFRFEGNKPPYSMKVGTGIVVTACTGESFKGTCKEYTEDVPYLGPQNLGGEVNSLKIFTLTPKDYDPGKPKADQVYACSKATATGMGCRFFGLGDNGLGSLDGKVESLRLGSDVKVFVCTDRKFTGTCKVYKSDVASLSKDGLAPVYSLRVLRRDEPDPSVAVAAAGTPLRRSLDNKLFTIRSVGTGQCLADGGGSSPPLEPCSDETRQQWAFLSAGSGRYFIRANSMGRGLQAVALDSTPVVHVVAVARSDSEQDEQWELSRSAEGDVLIQSAVADKNLEAGGSVRLAYPNNGPGQQWSLEEVGEIEAVTQEPSGPSPGSIVANVRLTGESLKTLSFDKRGARRGCESACNDDWSCKGYSVDAWAGQCILLSEVRGSEPASGWESKIQSSRAPARVPAPGQYAENTRLTGPTVAVSTVANLRDCLAACEADDRCRAFSKSPDGRCELKSATGEATAEQNWTSYQREPDMSVPPDQTMSSPLCRNHSPAFPPYALTTSSVWADTVRWLDLPSVVERGPIRPPTSVVKTDGLVDFTSSFYMRALPDRTVHFHSWYDPDVVLKRRDGEVVAGEPDEHSAWRLEHLFDHVDPPVDGVWIVIRDPENGWFLTMHGDRIEMTSDPEDPGAHWRYASTLLPGQKMETLTPVPVVEREPIVLDQRVVAALTKWAVTELVRQEQSACWKEGGTGDCPSGQDTDCGLFCAQSTAQCVLDVVDMVNSVSMVAANIAGAVFTGGSANAGLKSAQVAAKTAGKAAARTAMRQAMRSGGRALEKKLKARIGARVIAFMRTRGRSESFKKLAKDVAVRSAKNIAMDVPLSAVDLSLVSNASVDQKKAEEDLIQAYADEVALQTAQQFALIAAAAGNPDLLEIAALVDPTGVMGVVDTFNKPTCTETPFPDLDFAGAN